MKSSLLFIVCFFTAAIALGSNTLREWKTSLHMFEGGHQVPPPSVQEKAFRWLLGKE